jgi:hypothetical protein
MKLKIHYAGQQHNGESQTYQVELPQIPDRDRNYIRTELRSVYASLLQVTGLHLKCTYDDEPE